MAIIVKILQNSEQDACVKVKSDSAGGTISLTKDDLCYRADPNDYSGKIVKDERRRFQNFSDKSLITIRSMQWSGYTQEDSHGRIYRGDTLDLEHEVMSFCVGDTCQYEFMGQEMVADGEYGNENLTIELKGEMTVWIKLRKTNFANYSGEYAWYGQYEDDSKFGPKDEYAAQLKQVFGTN